MNWYARKGLPDSICVVDLEAALEIVEQHAAPADQKSFAAAILKLIKFGKAFGFLDSDRVADMTAFYREAMGGCPADLLHQAINETIRTWKWGNRMPLPSDLITAVNTEWSARSGALRVVRAALAEAQEQKIVIPKKVFARYQGGYLVDLWDDGNIGDRNWDSRDPARPKLPRHQRLDVARVEELRNAAYFGDGEPLTLPPEFMPEIYPDVPVRAIEREY